MSKYKVGGYVRLSRDDDYSESDSIQRQKYWDNFKEDINSI